MLQKLRKWFSAQERDAQLQKQLEEVRRKTPVPVFWLFGKTQSGKTSIVKFLTGAEDAEIGQGYRPCTRFSRQYQFPTMDAPLLTFLDTRGVDEPAYDVSEDLAQLGERAHVVIVTMKIMDHAQENVLAHLRAIRRQRSSRPVILVLSCLHEAYPQQQHPQPYPWTGTRATGELPVERHGEVPVALRESLAEQRRRFQGLFDYLVPIDLTQPAEGFNELHYGGDALKEVLLEALPEVYRQTLLTLDEATKGLQDLYARQALPYIVAYSSMAATAGAFPIPWIDMLVLPAVQSRMIQRLAQLYGQPLTGDRFVEIAGTLGMGMMVRQAVREFAKFIPFVGSVASAALAGAATYALGKAFCYYYSAIHQGHVPKAEDLKRYYQEQLAQAERMWRKKT
jgi:uncharacterized protein (DUF697 family)/predicted GTPase